MNTNDENNDILFSQASFRKDTYVKVNHRKDIDVVEFSGGKKNILGEDREDALSALNYKQS